MCIGKKVFDYEGFKLPVANILRYKDTIKSIRDYVDPKDKRKLSELGSKSKGNVKE